jgi:hypothetical protein
LSAHELAASFDWICTKLDWTAPHAITRLMKVMLQDNPLVEEVNGLNVELGEAFGSICKSMEPTKFELEEAAAAEERE